jgi:hypothetical protein
MLSVAQSRSDPVNNPTIVLVKDHLSGYHRRSHPECPICIRERPSEPEWVRRMYTQGLPTKDMTSKV